MMELPCGCTIHTVWPRRCEAARTLQEAVNAACKAKDYPAMRAAGRELAAHLAAPEPEEAPCSS